MRLVKLKLLESLIAKLLRKLAWIANAKSLLMHWEPKISLSCKSVLQKRFGRFPPLCRHLKKKLKCIYIHLSTNLSSNTNIWFCELIYGINIYYWSMYIICTLYISVSSLCSYWTALYQNWKSKTANLIPSPPHQAPTSLRSFSFPFSVSMHSLSLSLSPLLAHWEAFSYFPLGHLPIRPSYVVQPNSIDLIIWLSWLIIRSTAGHRYFLKHGPLVPSSLNDTGAICNR